MAVGTEETGQRFQMRPLGVRDVGIFQMGQHDVGPADPDVRVGVRGRAGGDGHRLGGIAVRDGGIAGAVIGQQAGVDVPGGSAEGVVDEGRALEQAIAVEHVVQAQHVVVAGLVGTESGRVRHGAFRGDVEEFIVAGGKAEDGRSKGGNKNILFHKAALLKG